MGALNFMIFLQNLTRKFIFISFQYLKDIVPLMFSGDIEANGVSMLYLYTGLWAAMSPSGTG